MFLGYKYLYVSLYSLCMETYSRHKQWEHISCQSISKTNNTQITTMRYFHANKQVSLVWCRKQRVKLWWIYITYFWLDNCWWNLEQTGLALTASDLNDAGNCSLSKWSIVIPAQIASKNYIHSCLAPCFIWAYRWSFNASERW